MDRWLRSLTPLALGALGCLLVLGAILPEHSVLARMNDRGFVGFAAGILCFYVAVLVFERQRMEGTFKEVLAAFRQFHQRGATSKEADMRREAVGILIGALASADLAIRQSSLQHLERLTGQDLGEDPAAWRAWFAREEGKAADSEHLPDLPVRGDGGPS